MTSATQAAVPTSAAPAPTPGSPWLQVRRNRILTGAALSVVVAAAVTWLVILSGQRKEAFAAQALSQAVSAADAGNLPLASTELQKVISTYGGSLAARQAVILLNQVRLSSGQTELAISSLRDFLKTKPEPRFAVQGYGLLGAALENARRPLEAAEAFLSASQAAVYPYLRAEYLLQAGRVYLEGGKAEEAAKLYRQIVTDYPKAPAFGEASVRLAELTQGGM